MKVNAILTGRDFGGKIKVKRTARLVFNLQSEAVGSVDKKWLFDLNGEKIARCDGKTESGFRYISLGNDAERTVYHFDGERLFEENGTLLGTAESKNRGGAALVPLISAAIVLIAVITLVSLSDPIPKNTVPVLVIREDGEIWGAEHDISLFSGEISPGKSGEYKFEIENPTESDLQYMIKIADENDWGGKSPVVFRLKMNNLYVGDGQNWKSAEEMTLSGLYFSENSKQIFVLEWMWPYAGGDDETDTEIGLSGGVYSLSISVTASPAEGSDV